MSTPADRVTTSSLALQTSLDQETATPELAIGAHRRHPAQPHVKPSIARRRHWLVSCGRQAPLAAVCSKGRAASSLSGLCSTLATRIRNRAYQLGSMALTVASLSLKASCRLSSGGQPFGVMIPTPWSTSSYTCPRVNRGVRIILFES